MEVDFRKRQHWDFFELPLNPDMVALHRYLIMRFRGDVTVMGKLWSSDEAQSDMNAPEVLEDGEWKLLKYDTTTANLKPLDRKRVARLLLFPAPGQRDAGDASRPRRNGSSPFIRSWTAITVTIRPISFSVMRRPV